MYLSRLLLWVCELDTLWAYRVPHPLLTVFSYKYYPARSISMTIVACVCPGEAWVRLRVLCLLNLTGNTLERERREEQILTHPLWCDSREAYIHWRCGSPEEKINTAPSMYNSYVCNAAHCFSPATNKRRRPNSRRLYIDTLEIIG